MQNPRTKLFQTLKNKIESAGKPMNHIAGIQLMYYHPYVIFICITFVLQEMLVQLLQQITSTPTYFLTSC
jgi:hypothetical protein